mgnify:CR=1 FL=1
MSRKLPIGIQDFEDIRNGNYLYVDKTALIYELVMKGKPYFLSRPRRFGKSLLVSTLHAYFRGKKELFQGLAMERLEKEWNVYPVLHLDFSMTKYTALSDLLGQLNLNLYDWEKLYGKEEVEGTPAERFRGVIRRAYEQTGKPVVVLIDEYDAPLTAVMGDKGEFERRRRVLSNFFSTIKAYSGKFRFIFITGVTRYSNTSIFSAFNNIEDISFNPAYGAIVGYTQEELEHYFKDYIEYAAKALNRKEKTCKYTYELILDELKNNYDGYSFDEDNEWHVYNPWSILNFLKNPQRGFKPYWLDTGGAKPSLLVNYLNTFIDKKVKKTELIDYLNLEFTKVTSVAELSPSIVSIEDEDFPFFAILYQAGYFTIKDTGINYLEVGLPNLEVKKAFAEIILNKLTSKTGAQISAFYGKKVKAALEAKDYTALKEEFNKILNEFSYESVVSFKEYAFRDVYKVMLQILGYNTYTEYQTALGRSDLCFEDEDRLYICEFKVIGKSDSGKEKLEEAKAQIREKRYGLRLTNKEVITLAIIIINENKDEMHEAMREVAAIEEIL